MKIRPFSLVELLVVVAVISLLFGLLAPALSKAKDKSKAATCQTNLRQIGMMLSSYSVDSSGVYPYAEGVCTWDSETGWLNRIAGQTGNRSAEKKVFRCPNEKDREFSYSLNCTEIIEKTGTFGSWRDSDFTKGKTPTSQLVIVEESDPTKFDTENCDQDNYNNDVLCTDLSRHGNTSMLLADGHVHPLRFFDATQLSYYTYKMSSWDFTP